MLSEEVQHFSEADITVQGDATVGVRSLPHAKITHFRPRNDKSLTYAFDLEMARDGSVSLFVEDEVFEDMCGNPNIRSNIVTVSQGGSAAPR